MLQTFLIGLREGLEASLVVGILVAFIVKSDRREYLPAVWTGVISAITLSFGFGAFLTFTSKSLSFKAQEAFGGFMSIIAVAFVTAMVFWMRSQSRHLAGEIRGKLGSALDAGPVAVALVAFLSVGREGLETALFLWPTFQANGNGAGPAIGVIAGLSLSVFLGWLIYRGAIRMNLATFFRVTGTLLVIVAAGVLAYGIHDLQEAGILPGLNNLAFDVSAQLPPSSWYGTLLKGIFNVSPQTTWLQAIAWVLYIVPVMFLFLRPVRPDTAAVPAGSVSAGTVPAGSVPGSDRSGDQNREQNESGQNGSGQNGSGLDGPQLIQAAAAASTESTR